MEDLKVLNLLRNLDEGRKPTREEINYLEGTKEIRWDRIETIPQSIQLLTTLEKLSLRDSHVSDIEPLSALKGLKELDLSRTEVVDVAALSSLSSLSVLDLSVTKVSDINALQHLKSLEELNLSATKITDIGALSALSKIQKLNLSHTEITDVDQLAGIVSLTELRLSDTKVNNISSLYRLTHLQRLYLANTRVTIIPSFIGSFEKMSVLDLSDLQLKSLPESLLEMEVPYELDKEIDEFGAETGIYLYRTDVADMPMDLFMRDFKDIQEYYRTKASLKKLYKYTSLDFIDSCLEKGVYASKLDQVNDPFEGRGIKKDKINNFRICCMTNSPKQKLLWAYYVNHKGCCIEYDVSKIDHSFLKKVDYVNGERDHSSMTDDEIYNSLYLKSNEWAHENEYRAVWRRDKSDSDVWEVDDNKIFLKAKVTSITLGLFAGDDKDKYKKTLELLRVKGVETKKCCMRPGKNGLFYDSKFDLNEELKSLTK